MANPTNRINPVSACAFDTGQSLLRQSGDKDTGHIALQNLIQWIALATGISSYTTRLDFAERPMSGFGL
jgi:hypothetical protein